MLLYKHTADLIPVVAIILILILGAVHKVCHAPEGGGLRMCDSL